MKIRWTLTQLENFCPHILYSAAKHIQNSAKDTFQKQMCYEMSFVWVQFLFSCTWLGLYDLYTKTLHNSTKYILRVRASFEQHVRLLYLLRETATMRSGINLYKVYLHFTHMILFQYLFSYNTHIDTDVKFKFDNSITFNI